MQDFGLLPWATCAQNVSLGLRVLSVDDLGFDHRGGNIFLAYQRNKERLAGLAPGASLGTLGIGGIP